MKKLLNIIALLMVISFANAQEIRYVSADNGLVMRDEPNRGSNRLGVLDYGSQIEILERTNLKLDVQDRNKIISGEWVKIRANDYPGYIQDGYVFSGFLTEDVLKKRFKASFDAFTVSIDGLSGSIAEREFSEVADDTLHIALEIGESIDTKRIKIKHHKEYRHIEVFQKHENSISIMNEGPHCDLINWKHFYSSWVPLKKASKAAFVSQKYGEKDWSKFINIDVEELKSVVKDYCGDDWANRVKSIKSVNEYPSGVSISKVFIKVIMTDLEGEKIEKVIAFEVPMGC